MKRAPALFGAALAAALATPATAQSENRTAIFAGGCFWCTEADYDKVDGVLSTVSGYIGGDVPDPTYSQVSGGRTGHYEAVAIEYDPSVVSYEELVDHFWRTVDPLDAGGQFCDRGDQYRTAVFVADDEERAAAEQSKDEAEERLGKEVVTEILPTTQFYTAEGYHQDYYKKNPNKYKFYRFSCGRDARLAEVWGTS